MKYAQDLLRFPVLSDQQLKVQRYSIYWYYIYRFIIHDKEKQNIFTFEKLEPAIVWLLQEKILKMINQFSKQLLLID